MDGNQFEQFVAQMLTGIQQSTDWMFKNQHQEIMAHDQKLAAAEVVLRKALDFVVDERRRIRPESQPQKAQDASILRMQETGKQQPKLSGVNMTKGRNDE